MNNNYNYHYPQQPASPQPAPPKNNTAKIIIAIIVATLVVLGILGGIILAVNKGWFQKDEKAEQQVQTDYTSYIEEVLLPQLGTIDTEHPEKSDTGAYAALVKDVNHDNQDDMLVAYAAKENGKLSFKIDYYSYDADGKTVEKKSDVTVKTTEEPTSNGEAGGLDAPDNAWDFPFEELMYSVDHEGKTYIIYEWIGYWEGYDYEAHVYTVDENGQLTEVGNLFEPAISSVGEEIIYSEKLPETMAYDDSDFNYSFDGGDSIRERFGGEDKTILYFITPEGFGDYEYNAHYASIDAAVVEFFRYYGVSKTCDVRYEEASDGRYFLLERPENVTYLYSYVFYYAYDANGERREVYEFNDYTDLHSRPATTPQTSAASTGLEATESDFTAFEKMVNSSFMWVNWNKTGATSATVDFSACTQLEVIENFFYPADIYDYFHPNTTEYHEMGDPQHLFEGEGESGGEKLDAATSDFIIGKVFNVPVSHDTPARVTKNNDYSYQPYYYDGDSLYVREWIEGYIYETDYSVQNYERKSTGEYEIHVRLREYMDNGQEVTEEQFYQLTFTATLQEDATFGRYWSIQKYSYAKE